MESSKPSRVITPRTPQRHSRSTPLAAAAAASQPFARHPAALPSSFLQPPLSPSLLLFSSLMFLFALLFTLLLLI